MVPAEDKEFIERGLEYLGQHVSDQETVLDVLANARMFNVFEPGELRTVAGFFNAYSVREGIALFKEGERGQYICLLVQGKMDVLKEGAEHERKKISTVRPGKTLGEMAVLDGLPGSATVVAAEPSVVILITRRNLELLGHKHPHLGFKLLWQIATLISQRLRQATGTLVDFLE